jgi:hypothetical protein
VECNPELARLRLEKSYIASSLKGRGLSNEQRIGFTIEGDSDISAEKKSRERLDIEKKTEKKRNFNKYQSRKRKSICR